MAVKGTEVVRGSLPLLVCSSAVAVVAAVIGPIVGTSRPAIFVGTFLLATVSLVVVDGAVHFSRAVKWSIIGIIYANLLLSMTPYEGGEFYAFRLFGTKELRLDNLMHGAAAAVAAIAVSEICLACIGVPKARWGLAVVSVLAALGLGALKELLDSALGGIDAEELMWSTGRDLAWNTMGACIVGLVILFVGTTTPRPSTTAGSELPPQSDRR